MSPKQDAFRRIDPLKGTFNLDFKCPPDKSLTHRALIFAAMASGKSVVSSVLTGADCLSTMEALRKLGVNVSSVVEIDGQPAVHIDSPGWDGWKTPDSPLDFGNSGTTTRLLLGVLSATPGVSVSCFGDESLSKRPMGRVVNPLREMGADISDRNNSLVLPLEIKGQELSPKHLQVNKASAQIKSAIILAGLNIDGTTAVTLPRGGRNHTEILLERLGANIKVDLGVEKETISVVGPFRPQPSVFKVPGDPSSAAFFCVLAAISKGTVLVSGVCNNPTRTGFMTVLERMGAGFSKSTPYEGDFMEPVVDLTVVGGSKLVATDIEPALVPSLIDELPVLAVAAMFAEGISRFQGLSELRVKESDRLSKTCELVNLLGGEAKIERDDLVIIGKAMAPKAFSYDPEGDHRLAMAAVIAGLVGQRPSKVQGPECVDVSFPSFFDLLSRLI